MQHQIIIEKQFEILGVNFLIFKIELILCITFKKGMNIEQPLLTTSMKHFSGTSQWKSKKSFFFI